MLKEDVGSIPSLHVQDLDISWTKQELISFFTFNSHKPTSLEFAGPKQFPNAYMRYDAFAIVIAALKYYHGMRYKGKLLDVRASSFPVPLKEQIQLYTSAYFLLFYNYCPVLVLKNNICFYFD